MSFTNELKKQIISDIYKKNCCRRSLLNGALCAKGSLDENGEISINVDSTETADFLKLLIKEFFDKDAQVSNSKRGGRCKTLYFASKAAEKYIKEITESRQIPQQKNALCDGCRSAFARGIFLVSGRMSDPKKQYCLELSLGNRVNMFLEHFENNEISLKPTKRKTENIIYTKNSVALEDFLTLSNLQAESFLVMNMKIEKSFKCNANRQKNFETVNIEKTVSVSAMQRNAILKLKKHGLFNNLPESLQRTAELRLENPDLSVAQLSYISTPPISKSGIAHRLSKLVELSEEITKKKKT